MNRYDIETETNNFFANGILVHNSNCRAGIVPTEANTFWKKIKKLFGQLKPYEYVYGSNNVELTNRVFRGKSEFGNDVFGAALIKVGAKEKLKPNEIIYGELIGEGVQKNYAYGLKGHDFVLFDVKIINNDGSYKWLNPEDAEKYASDRGFKFVPILYAGPYSKEKIEELVSGPSVYEPSQKVREGIVMKSRFGYSNPHYSAGKKVLKHINPVYLDDKANTDFH